MDRIEIKPQPRQRQFLQTSADIAIYGGAAGGGKSFSLLLEPTYHLDNPDFGAVIFRRTMPEITREGGLWDEAGKIYPQILGEPNQSVHQYRFPTGARVTFSHMQLETDKDTWKSSQIPLIEFDQLETFTASQFWYMMSRNRSTCGVKPYVRATCNPEPGWVADMLAWWISEDGYADVLRSGKVRWFIRQNETLIWADSKEELERLYPGSLPRSMTFILSTIYDNRILMTKDPGYLSNLQSLSLVDRERLLGDPVRGGNWVIKPSAGKVFNRAWFKRIDPEQLPAGGVVVRRWDFAATEKELSGDNPDYTASCLMLYANQRWFILDITAERLDPPKIDSYFEAITRQDMERFAMEQRRYMSRWEIEPGSAGKRESWRMTTMLAGIDAHGVGTGSKDKLTRQKPLATQVEAGNVYVVSGAWNELFLNHMHGQPELDHDDIADAAAGAFQDSLDGAPVRVRTNQSNVNPIMELMR
jgi:predicted phage terminase large subunit-like protein